MAMARLLYQTLPHQAKSSPLPFSPMLFTHRHRSGKAQAGQIFEIDLDGASSSSDDSEKNINGSVRKLEEVIQNIIVRRAAPDWLPFRPGSSYWVPPPSQNIRNSPYVGVVEVLGRMSKGSGGGSRMDGQIHSSRSLVELLSRDEAMVVSPSHAWPSPSYFNEGISPSFPVMEGDMEVEVKILDGTKSDSLEEDEDKEG